MYGLLFVAICVGSLCRCGLVVSRRLLKLLEERNGEASRSESTLEFRTCLGPKSCAHSNVYIYIHFVYIDIYVLYVCIHVCTNVLYKHMYVCIYR